jgi:hypothetical protein
VSPAQWVIFGVEIILLFGMMMIVRMLYLYGKIFHAQHVAINNTATVLEQQGQTLADHLHDSGLIEDQVRTAHEELSTRVDTLRDTDLGAIRNALGDVSQLLAFMQGELAPDDTDPDTPTLKETS